MSYQIAKVKATAEGNQVICETHGKVGQPIKDKDDAYDAAAAHDTSAHGYDTEGFVWGE